MIDEHRRGRPNTKPGEWAWRTPHKPIKSPSKTVARIFEIATEKKMPILEVASYLEMSNTGMHSWKTGRSFPNAMALEAFADAVGCKIVVAEKD